jgi:hypothetical protein
MRFRFMNLVMLPSQALQAIGHVQLPKNMLKKIPTDYFDSSKGTLKLLWEEEWREKFAIN